MGAQEMKYSYEIVIAGAGICGLATALALHRKGIKCIVLERSESLRSNGSAITILSNGWIALHQLGVASILRQTASPILGGMDIWVDQNKQQEISFLGGEARCLRRSDLINTLYNALPPETEKFDHQIASVKLDPQTTYPVIKLKDGTSIAAKVLIGCDGANSLVAEFLELKPTQLFPLGSVRGLTNYPNGHPFAHEFVRVRRNNILVGRIPVDDKQAYWFLAHPWVQTETKNISQDAELIRQYSLELIRGFPEETVDMIKNTDKNSFSFTSVRYRAPWDLLIGNFRKGTVTVAGDAMHVMGPFLAQGGSAALEDAVVLARNLSKKMTSNSTDSRSIGEALDQYVKERKIRLLRLSTQTYLTGKLIIQSSSVLVKFVCVVFMVIFFSNSGAHTVYDCGTL